MGCLCSKNKAGISELESDMEKDEKRYSWEKKENLDPKDFIIENIKNATVVKHPLSVRGQQFIIQNCENASIYIFDHINTASVDDCINCSVFLGPTKGSVFLRDCHESRFLIAAQQFRARDCKLVDVFLCCPTQPIIESCSDMRFGCFCYHYSQLEGHFQKAKLSLFNNNWYNIHDFTPADDEPNWSLLPREVSIEDFFSLPSKEMLNNLDVLTDQFHSVVPNTCGQHQKISSQSTLVVFFSDGNSQERAIGFIKEMTQTDNVLVRTKQVQLETLDAERIFGSDYYNSVVKRGPVIALEYNGQNCITDCDETAKVIATETGYTGLIYISTSSKAINKQLDHLFNYGDIQLCG